MFCYGFKKLLGANQDDYGLKVVIMYFMLKEMPAVLHDCAVSLLMLVNKQLFLIFFWLALRSTRQSHWCFAR